MTNENILNKTLEAFRGIKEYSSSGRVPKPCYAVIHIDGTTKLFHTNTSRQHKFIYNNPGALKNSIRNWLEYNVYDIVINQWGREDDWMVVYHLVTKAEEDKRRDSGMSILGEDYQFTRKAEEVASSQKTLFDKILDKLQNKS